MIENIGKVDGNPHWDRVGRENQQRLMDKVRKAMTEQPKPFAVRDVWPEINVYRPDGSLFAAAYTERDAKIIAALPLLVDLARLAVNRESADCLEGMATEALIAAGLDDEEGV